MLYLALALAAGWAASVSVLATLLRTQQRQHGRRQDQLINQLMHLAGRTWTPAPADTKPAATVSRSQILAGYTTRPGPDDEA